jgi:predicted acyltransferase
MSAIAVESAPAPAKQGPVAISAPRVLSVDALRGFDMFWILGGDMFMHALGRMSDKPVAQGLAYQLEHARWAGFRFYDLIFPMFVFVVGVSIVFSLGKLLQTEGKLAAHKRIFRRALLLFALGILYSGGFSQEWPNIRLLGVLNRIALCYLFAGLIFCHFKPKGIAAICAGLLLGYWALMTFVPFTVNGTEFRGVFEPGLNLSNYIDSQYLPGKRYDGTWDPEGLLSTLPAIGTCLLGVLTGLLLRMRSLSEQKKVLYLLACGVTVVILGWLWDGQFPVIKKIWTSSYVLVAGGYSAVLLACFHQMIEVWGWRKWTAMFVWIGANPITLYVLDNILGFDKLARRFAGGDVRRVLESTFGPGSGDLAIAVVGLALAVVLAWFLYRRKIFLRI